MPRKRPKIVAFTARETALLEAVSASLDMLVAMPELAKAVELGYQIASRFEDLPIAPMFDAFARLKPAGQRKIVDELARRFDRRVTKIAARASSATRKRKRKADR